MLGKNKSANADEHEYGTEHHTALIACKPFLSGDVFIEQPLCDENGVVVALPENKCGKDDIDNIELNA